MSNPEAENQPLQNNLLTDFSRTMDLIDEVEGAVYKKTRLANAQEAIAKLRKLLELPESSRPSAEICVATFTGDGITRWNLMGDGEVRFSGFHDQASGEKAKKAQKLGFKLF